MSATTEQDKLADFRATIADNKDRAIHFANKAAKEAASGNFEACRVSAGKAEHYAGQAVLMEQMLAPFEAASPAL